MSFDWLCSLGSYLSYDTPCSNMHQKIASEVHLKVFEKLKKAQK